MVVKKDSEISKLKVFEVDNEKLQGRNHSLQIHNNELESNLEELESNSKNIKHARDFVEIKVSETNK